MKLQVWLMLAVAISFLSPSSFSCLAAVPPKTSSLKEHGSFLGPPHLQTPDQEGTWGRDGGAFSTESTLGLQASILTDLLPTLQSPLSRGRLGRSSELELSSNDPTRDSLHESELVNSASRESELALSSTQYSRELDLAQSSDLASASTLSSSESELAIASARHLNEVDIDIPPQNLPTPSEEATRTLSTDYLTSHIFTEEVDSPPNPRLILMGLQPGQMVVQVLNQDQDLDRAVLGHVVPVILIDQLFRLTPILIQPPAPSFPDPSNNIPDSDQIHHHVLQIDPPQQPKRTSNRDDQLGIVSRSVAEVYRNERLSMVVLGYVVPVTLGMLTMNIRPSPTVVNLVLISMVVGFTAIWYGLLFRIAFPRFAIRIEQFGMVHVLASFFGLLSTYFPPSLAWLPWLCWALVIAPFTLTFSTEHQSRTTSDPSPDLSDE